MQFYLWQMLAILNLKLLVSVVSGNGTIAETNKAYHPSPFLPPKGKHWNLLALLLGSDNQVAYP